MYYPRMWPLAAIVSLSAATPCDELSVAVVSSLAGSNEPSLRALDELGARAIRERVCLSLAPRQEDVETIVDRCGADDACINDTLRENGAGAALLLIVVRTKNRWLLSVRWHRPGSRTAVASETLDAENS